MTRFCENGNEFSGSIKRCLISLAEQLYFSGKDLAPCILFFGWLVGWLGGWVGG
jgi:hypothetical protein